MHERGGEGDDRFRPSLRHFRKWRISGASKRAKGGDAFASKLFYRANCRQQQYASSATFFDFNYSKKILHYATDLPQSHEF